MAGTSILKSTRESGRLPKLSKFQFSTNPEL
jgi:hypothetical protein